MGKKGFVCQSCSNIVPENIDRCPHCGKFFKGVRCPECLYVGKGSDFIHGCPSCGYLSNRPVNINENPEKHEKHKTFPGWFYVAASVFLSLCIGAFVFILLNI